MNGLLFGGMIWRGWVANFSTKMVMAVGLLMEKDCNFDSQLSIIEIEVAHKNYVGFNSAILEMNSRLRSRRSGFCSIVARSCVALIACDKQQQEEVAR